MNGPLLKAEAIVAGRKMYEVSAATGICPKTLTEIFAGRRNLDQQTIDSIRTAIWGNTPKKLVLEDNFASESGGLNPDCDLASNDSLKSSKDQSTDA